jgi:hypothetical protein
MWKFRIRKHILCIFLISCSTRNTDKEKKANKDLQDYTLQQYIQPFYELQDNQGSLTHNNG